MSNEVIKRAIVEVLGSSAAASYIRMSENSGTVSLKAADLERVVSRAVKLSEDARRDEAMKTYAEHIVAQEQDDDAGQQAEIRARRKAIVRELDELAEAVARAKETIGDNPLKVRKWAELWARGLHSLRDDHPETDDALRDITGELRSLDAIARERVEALREDFDRYVDIGEYSNAEGRLRTGNPDYGLDRPAPTPPATRKVASTNDITDSKAKPDPRWGRPGDVVEDFDD